ncbi:MAG: hypothetical protein HY754_02700 [Nitrospirae bacterium]|nr:hypothetical protein [Nitrospirota bacterium]
MSTIAMPKKELETVVKESVREVLTQELMKFRALLLPLVSEKEQKDIERLYNKPSRKAARTVEVEI